MPVTLHHRVGAVWFQNREPAGHVFTVGLGDELGTNDGETLLYCVWTGIEMI